MLKLRLKATLTNTKIEAMKYNITYLIVTSILCVIPLSYAMENTHHITEITILKKPRFVEFVASNKAVIAGEDGCSIINLITNTEIKRINNLACSCLKTDHKKQKIGIATNNDNIAAYNTKNFQLKWLISWKKSKIIDIHFNKHDASILINYHGSVLDHTERYDYKKNKILDSYNSKDFYNDDSVNSSCLPLKSADALIKSGILMQWKDAKYCWNKSILVILCQPPKNERMSTKDDFCFIRYLDTKTETLIYETPELNSRNCYQLAISPHENQLLVACNSKCLLLDIPLEVIKNKVMFMYFVLKNYKPNANELLLHDIVSSIILQLCSPYIKKKDQ